MGKAVITQEALATSAARYRHELITAPMLALGPALNYFTLRSGIRYSETVGELSGDIELAPYDEDNVDDSDMTITPRTLYTYFGSVVKRFSPNSVAQSIYGSSITKGDELKNVDITLKVLTYLSAKIGKGLAKSLFNAVRNPKGKRTADLFDGLDTITRKEIKAGTVSAAAGNLYAFPEAITSDNAVEQIVAFCRAASDELLGYEDGSDSKGGELNLLVPRSVLYAYRDDYKVTTGHSPIYDKFNQTCVEGFDNIRLVPMVGKQGSDIVQLSTRNNLLIGVNQQGEEEDVRIEKHHEFKLSFVATLFFGTDYESIAPERLLVGQMPKTGEPSGPDPDGGDDATE